MKTYENMNNITTEIVCNPDVTEFDKTIIVNMQVMDTHYGATRHCWGG